MTHENIHIIRNEENPEALEILAQAILNIEKSMDSLLKSPIKRRVIVKLIQMNCTWPKPNIDQIETILDSLDTLAESFIDIDKMMKYSL